MDKFLVVTNPYKDNGLETTNRIKSFLEANGKCCTVKDDYDLRDESGLSPELITDADCILVLGGDGTLLRVAGEACDYDVPVFGINLGNVGFLAEGEVAGLEDMLTRLMTGDFEVSNRMMVKGAVSKHAAATYTKRALNDIVITRAGFSRLIKLNVYVGGNLLDTYEADGVVVSTPTGSTGYNLSAGGPIVSPDAELIVVTPVSPHSLTAKSIVLSANESITIEIDKKRKTQDTEAIVSFDGGNDVALSAGDKVDICRSGKSVKLIKASNMNFYEILRNKLGGN